MNKSNSSCQSFQNSTNDPFSLTHRVSPPLYKISHIGLSPRKACPRETYRGKGLYIPSANLRLILSDADFFHFKPQHTVPYAVSCKQKQKESLLSPLLPFLPKVYTHHQHPAELNVSYFPHLKGRESLISIWNTDYGAGNLSKVMCEYVSTSKIELRSKISNQSAMIQPHHIFYA